jgi:hypothetical protein
MNLTTKPIIVAEHNPTRPEFIRLPRPGTSDPWTSLSRSTLNTLVLPSKENAYCPPVRSCTLRRRGHLKEVRLIHLQSLLDFIDAHQEPTYAGKRPEELSPKQLYPDVIVREVNADEPLRIIISVEVENDNRQSRVS